MSNRTPTPNVMDALLGGAVPAPKPQKPSTSPTQWSKPAKAALAKQPAPGTEPVKPKAAQAPTQKPSGTADSKAVAKPKQKQPAKIKTKPTRVTPVSKQAKGGAATNPPATDTGNSGAGVATQQDKATFSMSQQTLDRLEQMWFDLRRGAYGPRVRCSKSEIAEFALSAVLDDFEAQGMKSPMAHMLVDRNGLAKG